MREKFQRFMQGRYGNDNFNQFILIVSMIVFFISIFTTRVSVGVVPIGRIIYYIGLAGIIYGYYRMLSRNIAKRQQENQKYLGCVNRLKQRKTHHIYSCPECKQKIRVPRGKGKIEVRCPKCGATFIKRS